MKDVIPTISEQLNRGDDNDHEVRLLIHQSHAGRVIGKGGTRIKELREETGSQIKIYMDCAPYSTERVVQITGSTKQITNCIGAMYETMEGVPPKGANMPYNPNNFDQFNATSYGGYTDERGGRRGPRDVRVSGGANSGNSGFMGGGGFGGGSGRFGDMSAGRGGNHMGGMSSFMNSRTGGNTEKVTTSQVSIPKGLAGAILGKGGSRIKQVQGESGTKIKLDDASPDSAERIISITGTQEQIQYAQYLLQMTVKRHAGASP
jgi:heterogeneous nuclear ribonucleoprotein K